MRSMAEVARTGYKVDDLDWLRSELGIAHLELDPWGSLIASPTDDAHGTAVAALVGEAVLQQSNLVSSNGLAWIVPGGTGYLMKSDLMVLAHGWKRVDELHFDPPPLLVVEVVSQSTRGADRRRKLADYQLGGAEKYLLVDLPASFELHDFAAGTVVKAEGEIDLTVGGQPVRFSLPA